MSTRPTTPSMPSLQEGTPEPAAPPARARALDDVVAVIGTYVALGVVGAGLWWLLCDTATFTVTGDGGIAMGDVELAKRFDADAWYAVIAALVGLLSGSAVTWWRSRDHLLTSGLLLVGSGVAAGVMSALGGWLGPADPGLLAATAEAGTRLAAPLAVDASVVYLVWPVSTLFGALLVLWSPPPSQ